jgi:hypothetical protein
MNYLPGDRGSGPVAIPNWAVAGACGGVTRRCCNLDEGRLPVQVEVRARRRGGLDEGRSSWGNWVSEKGEVGEKI